jgi:hypothetical protein
MSSNPRLWKSVWKSGGAALRQARRIEGRARPVRHFASGGEPSAVWSDRKSLAIRQPEAKLCVETISSVGASLVVQRDFRLVRSPTFTPPPARIHAQHPLEKRMANHRPKPTAPSGAHAGSAFLRVASREPGRMAVRASDRRHVMAGRRAARPLRAARKKRAPIHWARCTAPIALVRRTGTAGNRAPRFRSNRGSLARCERHCRTASRSHGLREPCERYAGRDRQPRATHAHGRERTNERHGLRSNASLGLAAKRSQTGPKRPKQKFYEQQAA